MGRRTKGRDLGEAVGTGVYGIRTEAPSTMPSGSGGPRHDVGEVQSGYATHRKTGYSPLRRVAGRGPLTAPVPLRTSSAAPGAGVWVQTGGILALGEGRGGGTHNRKKLGDSPDVD